jgi:hypothetical protein
MTDVWTRVFNSEARNYDDTRAWLLRPGVERAEFARQLIASVAEAAGWAAANGCDLDDADDRARLLACVSAVEMSLMPLRIGLAEAMTREVQGE